MLKRNPTLRQPLESLGTNLKRNSTIKVVRKPTIQVEAAVPTDPGDGKRKKRFWLF